MTNLTNTKLTDMTAAQLTTYRTACIDRHDALLNTVDGCECSGCKHGDHAQHVGALALVDGELDDRIEAEEISQREEADEDRDMCSPRAFKATLRHHNDDTFILTVGGSERRGEKDDLLDLAESHYRVSRGDVEITGGEVNAMTLEGASVAESARPTIGDAQPWDDVDPDELLPTTLER